MSPVQIEMTLFDASTDTSQACASISTYYNGLKTAGEGTMSRQEQIEVDEDLRW